MAATQNDPGISSEAVLAKTGKGLDAWFAILDAAKANSWPHARIATWLSEKQKVPPWWCQMLTVAYERARGLRAKHQGSDGWAASASRTLAAPLAALYSAWTEPKKRALWLGKQKLEITTANKNKSLRIRWPDDSRVDVLFTAKPGGKSTVAIQHRKLDNAKAVKATKAFWGEALDTLKAQLERS